MDTIAPADLRPQPLSHATALPARYYVDPTIAAVEELRALERGNGRVDVVARGQGGGMRQRLRTQVGGGDGVHGASMPPGGLARKPMSGAGLL